MKKIQIILLFALPGFAFAHEGHGLVGPHSPLHHLLEPVHALPALVLAAGVVLLLKAGKALAKVSGKRSSHLP